MERCVDLEQRFGLVTEHSDQCRAAGNDCPDCGATLCPEHLASHECPERYPCPITGCGNRTWSPSVLCGDCYARRMSVLTEEEKRAPYWPTVAILDNSPEITSSVNDLEGVA